MISKSQEEYLKTMYLLYKKNNNIRVTDIANSMNCSKASVNKAINILNKKNLLYMKLMAKSNLLKMELILPKN